MGLGGVGVGVGVGGGWRGEGGGGTVVVGASVQIADLQISKVRKFESLRAWKCESLIV